MTEVKHWAKEDGTFIGSYFGERPDDPRAQEVPFPPADTSYKWVNGSWVAPKESLLKYNKKKRKEFEEKGTSAPDGTPLKTSDTDQAKVTAAIKFLETRPQGSTISFAVSESDFVTLDLQGLLGIGEVIGQYVQSLFSKQAAIAEQINNGTITTKEEIDSRWSAV